MKSRIEEAVTLALYALIIVAVVVGLILSIFLVSGHKDLLSQMLQSTAKGELSGVAFTAGGPFAMWIAAFILLGFTAREAPLGTIRLLFCFPDPEMPPPSKPADFRNAKCWYLVFSNGMRIGEEPVTIHTHQIDRNIYVPYVYVKARRIENPTFQIRMEYGGRDWFSDSYSPKEGGVDLR
ncbi:MAG: hypothetical protein ACFFCW_23505 [Candidatus Hodarchaeota archaeon]